MVVQISVSDKTHLFLHALWLNCPGLCFLSQGAGNAFCGGMLAALVNSDDGPRSSFTCVVQTAKACAWGAVAASFMVRYFNAVVIPQRTTLTI